MTLQELLEHAFTHQWFTSSYTGPLQSYIKKYAKALGCEAKTCPPALYHLPDDRVHEIIYATADERLQPRSVQACVNAILKLLHRAVEEGCLTPFDQPPIRRRTHGIYQPLRYLQQFHPASIQTAIPPAKTTRYGLRLKDWPPALTEEVERYLRWCTPEKLRGRTAKIRKDASSQQGVRECMARIAGYAVFIEGVDRDRLTLRMLCEPVRLDEFAWWWIQERRSGISTTSLTDMLAHMKTIARHWYKDEPLAQAIVEIFRRLDEEAPVQRVREKDGRMLSLAELDGLAQAYHPFHPERLQSLKDASFARFIVRHLTNPERYPMPVSQKWRTMTFAFLTLWFELGFILRLLIHRPLRIGNIATLQFRHLHQQPDGGYEIVIPKAEMKNSKFMDRKAWKERFPTRLLPLWHDWLTIWRPRVQRQDGAFQEYVFLNSCGRPFLVDVLAKNLGMMTVRMTQDRHGGPVAWHPHLIRTTWTREMLNAGLNAQVVRRIMGDSFRVIEKHYGGYEEERPSPFALQLAREIEQRID
jgi:hypothetical protein